MAQAEHHGPCAVIASHTHRTAGRKTAAVLRRALAAGVALPRDLRVDLARLLVDVA